MYASPWSSDMPRSLRSEEHTSELQSLRHLVCRLLLEKKKQQEGRHTMRGRSGSGTSQCFQTHTEPARQQEIHDLLAQRSTSATPVYCGHYGYTSRMYV